MMGIVKAMQVAAVIRFLWKVRVMKKVDEIKTELEKISASTVRKNSYSAIERIRKLTDELVAVGTQAQVVEILIGVLERLGDEEIGSPGPIVHALEKTKNYKSRLKESLRQKPTYSTVWMANRILNSVRNSKDRTTWMKLLEAAAAHPNASEIARELANEFLEFQKENG